MALKHVMINDIIAENNARMLNLKKYYPFFVLNETTFSQYKDGRFAFLDMGYITLATLRFFINENNFHERDISFEEFEAFMIELLERDFELETDIEEEKELVGYIFDKLKNDGRAFEFKFYDPEERKTRIARVKLIDSRIENGQVLYTITPEGIEFYLDTKEVKEESKINISQLLLEKMITSNNFKGGIDVVKRINAEVTRIKEKKEQVLKLLSVDIFEGEKAYEDYMDTIARWFNDEQKLFVKNKALVDKAVEKASYGMNLDGEKTGGSKAFEEISLISRAKLRKLRPVFDFGKSFADIIKKDEPALMSYILMPLFAPKLDKTFSAKSIDNILSLKSEDGSKGEKVEKKELDFDFMYEDEILDKKIGMNFARLFYELLDQLDKWNKLTLKEFNGILEIKFNKEIYANRDLYAFLVHLAGKTTYSMKKMCEKQETLLEEMVVTYMSDEDKEKFKNIEFNISFGEEFEIEGYGSTLTDMTFEKI